MSDPLEPAAGSGTLNDSAARRGFATHEQRHADQTFIAHHGDFSGGAVLHHIKQGDDRGDRKIHIAEGDARFVQDLTQGHLDGLELRRPPAPLGRRECREKVIVPQIAKSGH